MTANVDYQKTSSTLVIFFANANNKRSLIQENPKYTMHNKTCEIAVIGGGIIGITSALALHQAGQQVIILEREAPGAGASAGNAGYISTEQIFPLGSLDILWQLPKILSDPLGPLHIVWRDMLHVLPWLLRLIINMWPSRYQHNTDALLALNRASLRAWQDLLDGIQKRDLLREQGSLLVYEKSRTSGGLQRLACLLKGYGIPVHTLTRQQLQTRIPGLSMHLLGALDFPCTAHVTDPSSVVEELFRAALQAGVKYRRTDVRGATLNDGGVILNTTAGSMQSSRVLIANGADAAPIVNALTGVRVPLESERGYHLTLPNEHDVLPVAVMSAERRFIMSPVGGGLRLAGTAEFARPTRPAEMRRAWMLERHASALFGRSLDNRNATPWMGRRPSLPDSLPVIDCAGPQQEVLMAFGHQHLGLTQAAFTAQLILQLSLGETPDIDMTPYRLTRFN